MPAKKFNRNTKKMDILKAAAKAFAQNGVSRTKMEDIAAIAGVGKGTIYEYFRSKEDIFHEAHKQFHKEIDQLIKNIIDSENPPDEKLRILMNTSLQLFFHKKNKVSIISSQELSRILMEFWAKGIREGDENLLDSMHLRNSYRKYRKVLTGVIEEGVKKGIFKKTNAHLLASMILAILDGIPLQRGIDGKAFRCEEVANFVVDNTLALVKK